MSLRRLLSALSLAIVMAGFAIVAGCNSGAPNITAPSGVSAPPTSSLSEVVVPVGPHTCPDGASPQGLTVNTHDSTATIFWLPEATITVYEIAIEHRPRVSRNIYVEIDRFTTKTEDLKGDSFYVDWTLSSPRDEKYRARIRTLSACSTYGPWSPYYSFETGVREPGLPDAPVTPAPEVPTTPVVIPPVVGEPIAGIPPPVIPPVIPPFVPPLPGSFYTLGANVRPFSLLAGVGLTCTTSTVTGDIGVAPGSSITGFPGLCSLAGTIQSIPVSAAAQADLAVSYAAFVAAPCTPISANLNGVTLTPGVYCSGAAVSNLTSTLTLNGAGAYVLKFPSSLITSPGSSVNLIGGATCGGVNWQVGSSATLAGTMVGNVIAFSSVTLNPGAVLTGRALALGAAVTMTTSTVTNAGCN